MTNGTSTLYPIALGVAKHEAGHYIVSRVHGFPAGSIELTIFDVRGEHSGKFDLRLNQPLRSVADIRSYLCARIQILYAGVLAQALQDGEIDGDEALGYAAKGGAGDRKKAEELLHLVRNIDYPDKDDETMMRSQLAKLGSELWNQAAQIVMDEHALIENLAQRLAAKVEHLNRPYRLSETELVAIEALSTRFA